MAFLLDGEALVKNSVADVPDVAILNCESVPRWQQIPFCEFKKPGFCPVGFGPDCAEAWVGCDDEVKVRSAHGLSISLIQTGVKKFSLHAWWHGAAPTGYLEGSRTSNGYFRHSWLNFYAQKTRPVPKKVLRLRE